MRKLSYSFDIERIEKMKDELVPAIFTSHQFDLILKKFSSKKMSDTEKNEFSRTVSRKMKAIYALTGQNNELFIYGSEKMITSRLEKAKKIIKDFSRKFKGKHVIISGSFLYNEKYNDIDIFVVSKYDKKDYRDGDFHINYLKEDVYSSLFFQSLKKICITNRENAERINEKIDSDILLSLYQELCNDLEKKHIGAKSSLREFILQSSYLSKSSIPDSKELNEKITAILKVKKPRILVDNILINTMVIGIKKIEALHSMKKMIKRYELLSKEYSNHKPYYDEMISVFKEVMAIDS